MTYAEYNYFSYLNMPVNLFKTKISGVFNKINTDYFLNWSGTVLNIFFLRIIFTSVLTEFIIFTF
jgi:hypothetical protein